MTDNLQTFLIINATLVLGVVIYLLWRRPRQGLRLRLSSKSDFQAKETSQLANKPDAVADSEADVRPSSQASPRSKSLTVMFNYNGHSWEAYEVLGLPAGSPRDRVEEAYQLALKHLEQDSHAFVETAYKAICRHQDN